MLPPTDDDQQLDLDRLLPIVVGAHPHAERHDRALAYHLAEQVERWQANYCDEKILEPLVLSDLWYLNHDQLQSRPTISIGDPRHNALSAYLTGRIPAVHAIDDRYVIRMDPTFQQLDVCIWGASAEDTVEAVDRFVDGYLDRLLGKIIDSCRVSAGDAG